MTIVTIDMNLDFVVFAEMLARSGKNRLLDTFEHDRLVDAFVAVDRIDDTQQLGTVHFNPSSCSTLLSDVAPSNKPISKSALRRSGRSLSSLPHSQAPSPTNCLYYQPIKQISGHE